MGNTKFIKILGMACTIIGFGLTIIEDRLEDIKTEKIIEKEVSKQIINKIIPAIFFVLLYLYI